MSQVLAPPVPSVEQAFLSVLRSRTAHLHTLLEQTSVSKSITAPDITLDAYIQYLQIMERVVSGMEEELQPILEDYVPYMSLRQKASLLQADLAHLGAWTNPFPTMEFSVPGRDIAFAWGAFYVLEGSALGGRVILKSLPASLEINGEHGARYFYGYGAQTGSMWKSFLDSLCEYAAQSGAQEAIIEGAEHTFALILEHFLRSE
jgi:heme oxygenase